MWQSIKLYYTSPLIKLNVESVRKKGSSDVHNVNQYIIVGKTAKKSIGNLINNFVNDEKTYINYHYVKGIVL